MPHGIVYGAERIIDHTRGGVGEIVKRQIDVAAGADVGIDVGACAADVSAHICSCAYGELISQGRIGGEHGR